MTHTTQGEDGVNGLNDPGRGRRELEAYQAWRGVTDQQIKDMIDNSGLYSGIPW